MADAAATGWVVNENQLGQIKITGKDAGQTVSTPSGNVIRYKRPLGTRVKASHATYGVGEFIYLLGAASTAVGEWVTLNLETGATTLLAANAIGPVGVSMSVNTETDEAGWYQIHGLAAGLVLSGFAETSKKAFITATGGSVDDTVVDGDLVHGATPMSDIDTPSTGLALFMLSYPYTDDIAGND